MYWGLWTKKSFHKALVANGETREGRRQLLRALEIAPTYEPALELLLELRGGRS